MVAKPQDNPRQTSNFGGNQRWYSRCYRPWSEAEVLDILRRNPGVTVKAVGSGHSWSDIAAGADIALDMSGLDAIELIAADGQEMVRVGAGCRLQDLLDRLHAMTDRTLPTLGAIKRQTISGAISTGTHGSGRQSLSHFVARIRAATFHPETGQPEIREFTEGPDLLAARCGLGCMGIILSVDIHTVPKYLAAETVRLCTGLDDAVARFADHPLTNFLWSPYSWTFMAFERRALERQPRPSGAWLKTRLYRVFNLVLLDILFHGLVIASRKFGRRGVKLLFTVAPYTVPRNITRVDDAEHILTTNHHYFRHEEMEIFVIEPALAQAMDFLRVAVEVFSEADSPALEALGDIWPRQG